MNSKSQEENNAKTATSVLIVSFLDFELVSEFDVRICGSTASGISPNYGKIDWPQLREIPAAAARGDLITN